MNDHLLNDALRQIGKKCFVTFYEEFCDTELSHRTVASIIAERWGRDFPAALTRRVYPARNIIAAGRGRDALIICSKSRLPRPVRDRAAFLANHQPNHGD